MSGHEDIYLIKIFLILNFILNRVLRIYLFSFCSFFFFLQNVTPQRYLRMKVVIYDIFVLSSNLIIGGWDFYYVMCYVLNICVLGRSSDFRLQLPKLIKIFNED